MSFADHCETKDYINFQTAIAAYDAARNLPGIVVARLETPKNIWMTQLLGCGMFETFIQPKRKPFSCPACKGYTVVECEDYCGPGKEWMCVECGVHWDT
jgi:hypothetical protein